MSNAKHHFKTLKKYATIVNHYAAYPLIICIRIYQLILSPDKSIFFGWLKGIICHHQPHCSQYGLEVLKKYGLFPGIVYMTDRITSCTGSSNISHDPSSYRVVFCSSAPIGVPFLEALENDPRYDVVGVVTNPDQPVGRGMKIKKNIIKKTAEEIDSQKQQPSHTFITTPASLRLTSKKHSHEAEEHQKRLQEKKPDLLVVIAYGKIIPQHILDIPTIAPINVHGSLLPAYRGASPIQSVLLDQKTTTGITIMRMEAGLDTGPMIEKKEFPLHFSDTALDIIESMKKIGPHFLNNTMRNYVKGHIDETPQSEKNATHCGKLEKTRGLINPRVHSLQEIFATYKGCYLRPKTYFILDQSRGNHQGKQITISDIVIDPHIYQQQKTQPLFSILNKKTETNPAVTTISVKPSGSKQMSWNDFLQGHQQTNQLS